MPNTGARGAKAALLAALIACPAAIAVPAVAQSAGQTTPDQPYGTLAAEPDPSDFVTRADARLTLLGDPIRFSGADLPWLGVRAALSAGAPLHVPTAYEVHDVLATLQVLGGTVIRARTAAGSAGCPQCIEPSQGRFNDQAFAQLDMILKQARDMGLKIILPLAGPAPGGSGDCNQAAEAEPVGGGICTYVKWQGGSNPQAFFTDDRVRAAYLAHVTTVLTHVNALTGVAYADDPTIIAWENCEGCGRTADPAALAAWTEQVGRTIHQDDHHHLYENGAAAGRIFPGSAAPLAPAIAATPSVDIVGDTVGPQQAHPAGGAKPTPRDIANAGAGITASQRAYIIDSFDWSPATWSSQADLDAFTEAVAKRRDITGALVAGLDGHADAGGYLPPGETPALYFPGRPSAGLDMAEADARGRAIRHLGFEMGDIRPIPNFPYPPPPEIIAVAGGRITWRGSPGARFYSIERSADPSTPGSWSFICKLCVTDAQASWQDPSVPKGPVWYRISAANANDHVARPSQPVANR